MSLKSGWVTVMHCMEITLAAHPIAAQLYFHSPVPVTLAMSPLTGTVPQCSSCSILPSLPTSSCTRLFPSWLKVTCVQLPRAL